MMILSIYSMDLRKSINIIFKKDFDLYIEQVKRLKKKKFILSLRKCKIMGEKIKISNPEN